MATDTIQNDASAAHRKKAAEFADLLTRRSCLLNLTKGLNQGNVSFAQYLLLGFLEQEDELTTLEVAKRVGHSTAAATGLMDRLEKLGYVQRFSSDNDRRSVVWKVTRKGSDLLGQLRETLVDSVSEILANEPDVASPSPEPAESEADLIEALSSGLPDEFWRTYQALKKAGNPDLPESEVSLLTAMTDQIEQADAARLEAAAKLAELRGISFDEVVREFEIGAVAC